MLVEVGALISWCISSYRIVMLLVPYMWASITFLPCVWASMTFWPNSPCNNRMKICSGGNLCVFPHEPISSRVRGRLWYKRIHTNWFYAVQCERRVHVRGRALYKQALRPAKETMPRQRAGREAKFNFKAAGDKLLMNTLIRQNFGEGLTLKILIS